MVPLESDLGASRNLDGVINLGTAVAGHEGGGDILNGVVAVGGCANSEVLALVLAANDEGLEGGVGRSHGCESSKSVGVLHFDDGWLWREKW